MQPLSVDNAVEAGNWVDLVRTRARRQGNQEAYVFLDENGREADCLTFQELDNRARAVAERLTETVGRGERALLLYPAGLDYVAAFFGCLYAGVIGIPLFAPGRNRSAHIAAIAADATAAAVLTTAEIVAAGDTGLPFSRLPHIATDTLGPAQGRGTAVAGIVAYLQYTSGSTSAPKGVVIDHAMSINHCGQLARAWLVDNESVVVSWLPHFHDYGQVNGILLPVYAGCRAVLMAPTTFAKNPIRWLDAVTTYRGTHSGAPNFAFDLCVDKTTAAQRASLDLRSWRHVGNGAEPVRKATLDRFEATFTPHGLDGAVLTPGYGLAEATLVLTCGGSHERRVVRRFDPQALGRRRAEIATAPGGLELVGVGAPVPGTEIAIVDPESGRILPDGVVGEIWAAGPSVSPRYWGKHDDSARTFGARFAGGETRWLRTGDLGFVDDGELFVNGRLKNMMIVNGVNYYLEDIEATAVGSAEALRAGGVLAFGVGEAAQERLALVAEYRADGQVAPHQLAATMRDAVARRHGIAPITVVLIVQGAVPRTTSGKLRRQECRSEFLAGRLPEIYRWTEATTDTEPLTAVARVPVAGPQPNGLPTMTELVRQGLLTQVSDWIAANAGPGAPAVEADRTLAEHGFGSVDQMNLHQHLEDWAGKQFAPELMWDAESIGAMASAIAEVLTGVEPGESSTAATQHEAVA
ncbi:AMP-binding protein [Nocardia sp. NPDC049149]|uniref:AMP-binding protein n=1 Tax=Nocardia sp. NPDC049149 TaxID=3364315 RepID=UPI0037100FC0